MREEVDAWPPGACRSTRIVRRPSGAPYTAAARPAGTDDRPVVDDALRGHRLQAQSLRDLAKARHHEARTVRKDHEREVVARLERRCELRACFGIAQIVPAVRDVVA